MSQNELWENAPMEPAPSKTDKGNRAKEEKGEPAARASCRSGSSENLLSEITIPTPQISTDSNGYRYRKNVSIYAGRMRGAAGKRVITLTSTERDSVDIDVTIEDTDRSTGNSDLVIKVEERLWTGRERDDDEQREVDLSDGGSRRRSSGQTKKSSDEATSADDKETKSKARSDGCRKMSVLSLDDSPSPPKSVSTDDSYGPCDFEFGINDVVEDSYVFSSIE